MTLTYYLPFVNEFWCCICLKLKVTAIVTELQVYIWRIVTEHPKHDRCLHTNRGQGYVINFLVKIQVIIWNITGSVLLLIPDVLFVLKYGHIWLYFIIKNVHPNICQVLFLIIDLLITIVYKYASLEPIVY